MSHRGTRVAVTGIGLRSPAGDGIEETLTALHAARSTAARVPELLTGDSPVTFACRVPSFDAAAIVPPREQRQTDRSGILLAAAAAAAWATADLEDGVDRSRLGVSIGTGAAGIAEAGVLGSRYGASPAMLPAYTVPRVMSSSPAARLSIRYRATGPSITYATACSSGATAIGEAVTKLRLGMVDACLAGGVDSCVTPMLMSAFARIGALSTRNDDPAAACRPFDDDRDGFVMGEGAAVLVLERWEHATARGAAIMGEVLGFGCTSDACHIVAPRSDGATAADCVRAALCDAGLDRADIGHINAHGTSTVLNDHAEALALAAVFGDDCPPVTANKGVTGHLIGASGAFEAAAALLCAAAESVPPVANFGGSRESELLDLVVGAPRPIRRLPVMSNSFGFGGHNTCLVLAPA